MFILIKQEFVCIIELSETLIFIKVIMVKGIMKISILIVFFTLIGFNVFSIDYLSIDGGAIKMLNAEENSAPGPLMPTFGVSFNILPVEKPLLLEAGLLFFGTGYQYINDRAVPAELEAANSLFVLGILLEARFGYLFTLTDMFKIGGTVGIASVFRFPVKAYDNGGENQGDAVAYFLPRFLYPEVEVTFRWKLKEKIGLSLGVRCMLPIFHIWDGESLPFYDQMMFSAIVGVQFYFSKKE